MAIQGPPGAGRTVATAVLLFLLAIVTARLLLTGGLAWTLFLLGLPVLVLVLTALLGFLRAILFVAVFAGLALLGRALLLKTDLGWVVFLLLPALALAVLVCARTIVSMMRPREAAGLEGDEDGNGDGDDGPDEPGRQESESADRLDAGNPGATGTKADPLSPKLE